MSAFTETIDWISVDERLPDADETVLINRPRNDEPVWLGYYEDPENGWLTADGWPAGHVTHWAPVPQGPTS